MLIYYLFLVWWRNCRYCGFLAFLLSTKCFLSIFNSLIFLASIQLSSLYLPLGLSLSLPLCHSLSLSLFAVCRKLSANLNIISMLKNTKKLVFFYWPNFSDGCKNFSSFLCVAINLYTSNFIASYHERAQSKLLFVSFISYIFKWRRKKQGMQRKCIWYKPNIRTFYGFVDRYW